MIDPKELRIGNAVTRCFSEDIRYVEAVLMSSVYLNGGIAQTLFEDIHRIPLTADILEKCGFAENKGINHWHSPEHTIYTWNGFHVGVIGDYIARWNSCVDDFFSNFTPQIKTVHFLQNLVYVETGEELTVIL